MKRTTSASLLLLFVLAQTITLAQDEAPATRGKAGETLTPMAMGNAWVYASEGDDMLSTDRIEGVILFDDTPWYLLRSYEHEKGQPENTAELVADNFWIASKNGHEWDAWAEIAGEDDVDKIELTMLSKYYRYPATLGETYKPNADDPTLVINITALNEKVKTKAGEFECVVYKETNTEEPGFTFTSWVAPGVGVVKYAFTEDGESSSSELVSYTLVD